MPMKTMSFAIRSTPQPRPQARSALALYLLGASCAFPGAAWAFYGAGTMYGAGIGNYIPPAQQLEVTGVPVGPMTAYPSLALGFSYDDNIYRVSSNEKGSWVAVVAPAINLDYRRGVNDYTLAYQAYITRYGLNSNNNAIDQQVLGTAALSLTPHASLNLNANYLNWHDPLGQDFPVGTVRNTVVSENGVPVSLSANHPDAWNSTSFGGIFTYGAQEAKGRFELLAEQIFRHYTNNGQEARDVNTTDLGGTFYYRVAPKTSLLAGVLDSKLNYTNQPPGAVTLDSNELFYNAGAQWDVTDKTTGIVRLGYRTKNFDASERGNFSGFAWDARGIWRAATYSTYQLLTGLTTYETTTTSSNYVKTQYVVGQWTRDWRPRFSTILDLGYALDDYVPSSRQDNRFSAAIRGVYQLRSWLTVSLGYDHNQRHSNETGEGYGDNVYLLYFQAAM
jgi:hypothetical protein